MKLNKKGWGLRAELGYILLFVIFLTIASWGIAKFNLKGETSYENNNIKKNEDVKSNINKTYSYKELETMLIESGKEYMLDNYNNEVTEDTILRANHLINKRYLIDNFVDINNKKCSGYVLVIVKEDRLSYDPYIKCSEYQTSGYDERKDW